MLNLHPVLVGYKIAGREMDSSDDKPNDALSFASELYSLHARWLYRTVRKFGGGELTEDIVQEAFLRASLCARRTNIVHPRALLKRIAENLMNSAGRQVQLNERINNHYLSYQVKMQAYPEQFEAILLKELMQSLPTIYLDALVLSRFSGLSHVEIANLRGISVKSVEWRISRALAICAEKLRD